MINQQRNLSNSNPFSNTDRVEVVFYADPLCCWSWAILPEVAKLKVYNPDINLTYCMGGLIKDWSSFTDPLNNVNKPSQMGPIWMEASLKTGVSINDNLWVEDPPMSSYPACIAVKTAGLQSLEAEIAYFEVISKAAMVNGKNISKPETLVEAAEELSAKKPDIFDMQHFIRNYNNELSRNAFKTDLQSVKLNNIGRFPTITMTVDERKLLITGFHKLDI